MKVLLLTWGCDLEDISESEITAIWVREIAKDHDVTLLAVSKPERYGCVQEQFPEIEVIEWKDIPMPHFLERFRAIVKPGYFFYYFKARRFLKKYLKTREFDVIHHLSPFAWRYPSPAAGLSVPAIKGPVAGGLMTPKGLDIKTRKNFHPFSFLRKTDKLRMRFDFLLRYSYRNIDHVLMAAPYVKELLSSMHMRSSSIEIEHALPDEKANKMRDKLFAPSETINLIFVGRIIETKGLVYALRAIKRSKHLDKIRFTVIGDGDQLQSCIKESEEMNISSFVDFLGWCKKDLVEEYYKSSDIFLFPSFREPTGGVLLEALSHGLPCVTCAYGGPDYIIDDSCGIKVHPADENSYVTGLCDALDHLIENPSVIREMSASASDRAQHYFAWKDKRRRINSLYEKVAKIRYRSS
jgi:glycosyltransferase involved in cell wall biosynthesis